MAKVVGITGLIASGKSTLTEYLLGKGYKVFDSDREVKKLYTENSFLNRLQKSFPEVFANKKLDKSLLSSIVFSDTNKRRILEQLIHPTIEKKCDDFIKNNINEKVIFLDIPLLFEVGWDKKCDEIILITINRENQLKRYLERGGKIELFEKIIQNQGNMKEKILKSTYILDNNDTTEKFYRQIDKLISKNF